MDTYDLQHPETGSSNISKASPEWAEVLAEARERHRNGTATAEYVLHTAYEIVNEQVKAGIAWAKCMGCGSPFRPELEGSLELCSDECVGELERSLGEGW